MKKIHAEIIGNILNECVRHGISFHLSYRKKVVAIGEPEELGCSGFFDADNRILAVATKRPFNKWFPLLLHEFNHFKQWVDDPNNLYCYDDLWTWIEGKDFTKKQLQKSVNSIRHMELDCERRTANLIASNPEIGISVSDYIKTANAYLYFYTIMYKYRKWVNKKSPYSIPEILDLMPDKFLRNYWDVPKKYEEIVVKKCIF